MATATRYMPYAICHSLCTIRYTPYTLSRAVSYRAEAARRYRAQQYATVAMKEVEFHAPVRVGDVVSFYTRVVKVGRTSITIHVDVESRRFQPTEEVVKVTEADVIFVALDSLGKPTSVDP